MIRDERWKLIKYNAGGVKNAQLFDLRNDPDELNNLATNPKCAKQRARLEKQLVASRKELGDPVDFENSDSSHETKEPGKQGKKNKES
jgi:arylsulfatase A-like enzyme